MSAQSSNNKEEEEKKTGPEESKDQNQAIGLLALAMAAIATVGMTRGAFDFWGTMLGVTMFCIIWGYAPRYKRRSYPATAVSLVGGFSFLFMIGFVVDRLFDPPSPEWRKIAFEWREVASAWKCIASGGIANSSDCGGITSGLQTIASALNEMASGTTGCSVWWGEGYKDEIHCGVWIILSIFYYFLQRKYA